MSDEDWKARALAAEKELEGLRILAAEPHAIEKVRAILGPLSLWSNDALKRYVDQEVAKALSARPEVGEIVNLPGLKRALELCDQSRAYFEVSARPLSAEHEWAVRVRLTSEIERLERLEIGQQLNNGQGRANQTRK